MAFDTTGALRMCKLELDRLDHALAIKHLVCSSAGVTDISDERSVIPVRDHARMNSVSVRNEPAVIKLAPTRRGLSKRSLVGPRLSAKSWSRSARATAPMLGLSPET